MRGTFDFDPAQCEYGAPTAAIRQILSEWAAIDWFAPPRDQAAQALAARLFAQHNALARERSPELFPAEVEARPVRGGWRDFVELAGRVRAQSGWDWKYEQLKKLSSRHSKAHGWTIKDQAPRCVAVESGGRPRPGDLFMSFGGNVMWTGLSPRLDLKAALPPEHVEPASWYLSYANMDVTECIEWQLAEDSDATAGNPFLPLLRCYVAGVYPFSIGATTVLLFAFNE